jgi:uncharacterized membrane protein
MFRALGSRPYLVASIATIVAIYFFSGLWEQHEFRRELIAWDGGVLLFLSLTLLYMRRTGVAQMKERASAHSAGAHPILFATVLAAVASVGALVAELSQAKGEPASGLHVLLAGSTVVLSWLFVQFIFAIHYAHLYYLDGSNGGVRGGLSFGAYGNPDYWISCTFRSCSAPPHKPRTSPSLRERCGGLGRCTLWWPSVSTPLFSPR